MKVKNLHSWNVSYKKAREIQESLRKGLIFKPLKNDARYIAGADVSYEKHGDVFYAGVVVYDLADKRVIEEKGAVGPVDFPYIPGLLSFREAPVLMRAFRKIRAPVDAVIVDGQGIAHPRGFGLASHVSLLLDVPGVGCAKTRLVGEHGDVGEKRGKRADLTIDGERIGVVLRTKDRVKPVYVSPGHLVDVDSAAKLVIDCSAEYRLPEPTRLAHLYVNKMRREAK